MSRLIFFLQEALRAQFNPDETRIATTGDSAWWRNRSTCFILVV